MIEKFNFKEERKTLNFRWVTRNEPYMNFLKYERRVLQQKIEILSMRNGKSKIKYEWRDIEEVKK